jgi:hypothetical protein
MGAYVNHHHIIFLVTKLGSDVACGITLSFRKQLASGTSVPQYHMSRTTPRAFAIVTFVYGMRCSSSTGVVTHTHSSITETR